ncbi:protein farnesyltransferase/geranylgeranyltransferase type-1 subunit alpha [Anaeramoeba flamelloides]|uniref:Protein farnesyltransferase/geranylgeranyltransferase type-1 subunit alpha n=1 Tax=Anaeramoeba flamelloides TaxID=1746091 RepID=A0ABQ8YRN9_9EUKA|nr:protein farnesyltransferase/geranylgeranyltransferase type-1 subunit alpha [Anaeramoeba flamelloides]
MSTQTKSNKSETFSVKEEKEVDNKEVIEKDKKEFKGVKKKEKEKIVSNIKENEDESDDENQIEELSSDSDYDWTPYSKRPEWKGVEPIPQNNNEPMICPIDYSREFKEIMEYFRFVLENNEISERTFELTFEVISYVPGHYSAWWYRRILIEKLNKDLMEEMEFLKKYVFGVQKNYQLWQHRKCIADRFNDGKYEKEFSKIALYKDAKNLHAWSYRIWSIQRFNLWDGELEFVERMLQIDYRNNSAWTYRKFIVTKAGEIEENLKLAINECTFALEKLAIAANNEAAWVYLKHWILKTNFEECQKIEKKVIEINKKKHHCFFPDEFLIFIYEKILKKENYLQKALQFAQLLKIKDPIRKKFWCYKIFCLKKLIN